MNYILLDLEWNSAYSSKNGKFVNEIIEIGAVKLNRNLEEIDSFRVTVRSQLTRRLSGRFKTLTGITNEEMLSGVPFSEGLRQYGQWVESDDITMTWSNTDLYVLLDNCRLFGNNQRIPCVYRYIDVQKYVQDALVSRGLIAGGHQIALSDAASAIGIDTENMDLHRAETDSRLTCLLLRETFDEAKLLSACQDTTAADYYDRLTYKAHFISDIHSPLIDRKQLKFCCDICGKPAKRISKWLYRGRFFRSEFHCENCGNDFVGRVAFKKYYDSVAVKRSVVPVPVPEETEEPADTEAAL